MMHTETCHFLLDLTWNKTEAEREAFTVSRLLAFNAQCLFI